MRLWMRLSAVHVAVAMVALLMMGIGAMQISTESAKEASQSRLEREASANADAVSRWTADVLQFLSGWTRPYAIGTLDPGLQQGLVRSVYISMPRDTAVVVLVDADGLPLGTPAYLPDGSGEHVAASASDAEALVQRLPLSSVPDEVGRGVVGTPYWPEGADTPWVPFVVLADHVDGAPIFLGAAVRLAVADDLLRQTGAEHVVGLLDGGGAPLSGGRHALMRARLLQSLRGLDANFTYRLEAGEEVEGVVAPVAGTDWTVVVAEPASVVGRPAQRIRQRMLLVAVLGVGAAIVLGVFAARSLSQPVRALRDTALGVAEGRYGLLVPVERADEIGELGRAFNYMSERLRVDQKELGEKQAEIEAFNLELQDRVRARTRDLELAQAELVRSGQLAAVAEVAAGLAHELNNPLASVLGLAQLLERQATGAQAGLLADLLAEAERCREVVAQMRALKDDARASEAAPVLDLRPVVEAAVATARPTFDQRGVTLSWDAPERPVFVRVEPSRGEQVLVQVLHAWQAGLQAGSSLVVSLRDDGGVALRADSIVPDAAAADDWQAAGLRWWVARQLAASAGAKLDLADGEAGTWVIRWPGVEA